MAYMSMKKLMSATIASVLAASIAGCGGTSSAETAPTRDLGSEVVTEQTVTEQTETEAKASVSETRASVITASLDAMVSDGVLDTSDLFTTRDLEQKADLADAQHLTLTSGQDISISEEGVYVLSGTAENVTVTVDADGAKVQLVLDGASITNEDFPAIYVKAADKVFITTAEGSTNALSVTGAFVADGDTNTDAVIFSRDDLVLNGLGTLAISSTDNGITSKDDIKVTGGTLTIDCVADALEAHDSIRIADGTISITTQKDGLHVEDEDDDTTGYAYICGGSIDIDAGDDGIHATTYVQIDGGTLHISAGECIEATYVQVNGGDLTLSSWDDGINASYKSNSIGAPVIDIRGGNLSIAMAQGDTDALDSNGYLLVSGGTIDISAQFAFDFELGSEFTGGTIYVNGEQVSEITESMMMGGPGGGMGGPGGGMGGPGGGMGGPGW